MNIGPGGQLDGHPILAFFDVHTFRFLSICSRIVVKIWLDVTSGGLRETLRDFEES